MALCNTQLGAKKGAGPPPPVPEVEFAYLIGQGIVLATAWAAFLRAYGVSRTGKFKPKVGGTNIAVLQLYNILDPLWPTECEEKSKGRGRMGNIFSIVHTLLRELPRSADQTFTRIANARTNRSILRNIFFKLLHCTIFLLVAFIIFLSPCRMFISARHV